MIDIALFGLGRIGIMHGKNLMRSKDFNLKYIYDIKQKLSKSVETYQNLMFFTFKDYVIKTQKRLPSHMASQKL